MTSGRNTSAKINSAELPESLFHFLHAGALGIAMTVGDDLFPTSAFIWVVALDNKRVRISIDHKSTTLANLERDGRIAVQVIGPDNLVFLIKGEPHLLKTELDEVPMAMGLWEMKTREVRDQSWKDAAPLPLAVQWSGENRKSLMKVEQAVFAEMRDA